MLTESTLFEKIDKVGIAIERLKTFEPPEGYYLAFSGGKDSVVIKELANISGVKYDSNYNLTTIDPPELVQFIKKEHPDVAINKPERSFFTELLINGVPTRTQRWCCRLLKERGGSGRIVVTGIRKEESFNRSKRKMVESCRADISKRFLHPIIDWTKKDVWTFIKDYKVPYCSLYDNGWDRIGCLFCPMRYYKSRVLETKQYPIYTKNFIKAFNRLYEKRSKSDNPLTRWGSGEEMFWHWVYDTSKNIDRDQMSIFD